MNHLVGEVADEAAGVGQGAPLHDARARRQQGDQRALAGGGLRMQGACRQQQEHQAQRHSQAALLRRQQGGQRALAAAGLHMQGACRQAQERQEQGHSQAALLLCAALRMRHPGGASAVW